MDSARTLKRLAAASVALVICVSAASAAATDVPSVYLSSAACATCRPTQLLPHPATVIVGGDSQVIRIRWTHWGAGTTTGHGRYESASLNGSNGGDPGGTEPATLIASHPIQCGELRVYSHLAETGPGDVTPTGKHFSVPVPFHRSSCEFYF